MKKPVVPFIKIPNERNPALLAVSIFCRGLAMELYMFSCNYSDSGYDPSPIPIYGNWHVCLAKLLQVDPLERGNFARMLDRLAKVGVLVVENNFVHVRYSAPRWTPPQPDSDDTPDPVRDDSADSPPVVRTRSAASPPPVRQDITPRNDSTHVLQIREEKSREEERETRARPELRAVEPDTAWIKLGKHYQALFDAEQQGTRAPRAYDEQRITSVDCKQFCKLLELVKTEAARSGTGPKQIFEAAALAFLRDPKQREKGFVLEFFARDFTHYVDRSLEVAS